MTRNSLPVGVALAASLLLGACGGDGGSTAPDERCFGAAQVPAWALTMNVDFTDAGAADTFASIHLNHHIAAHDTTGPAAKVSADGWTWSTEVPHGTLSVHDTLIGAGLTDTLAGVVSAFSPRGTISGATISGMFISVNLATCMASVQGQFVGPMGSYLNGALESTDTTFIGYGRFGPTQVDSAAVAAGWSVGPVLARTITVNSDYVSAPEYRVASLTGPYVKNNAVAVFDSATVSWSAVPVAASPIAPRIRDGRIVAP